MKLPISTRFQDIVESSPEKTLVDVMKDFAGELGINHISYLSVDGKNDQDEFYGTYIEATYPGAWIERYYEQDYQNIDPVVTHGLRNFLPLDWSKLFGTSDMLDGFFGEAQEFGVQPRGLTIPVRDANNVRSVFSVNTDLNLKDWQDFVCEHVSDLTYLAFLYNTYSRERREVSSALTPELSAREIEVLHWTAVGKTTWQTSMIVGLAENTVKFYLKNVIAKMGCANRVHAVAKAVSQGIVTP